MLGLALLLVGAAARASEEVADPAVATAIVKAVRARVGDGFQVQIEELSARVTRKAAAIEAVPVPGARLSQPVRFAIVTVPEADAPRVRMRIGDAVARVRVSGPVVRAARDLPRAHAIAREDLVVQDGDAGDAPLGPLPDAAQAIGAETVREIRAGELLTPSLIRAAALVESGQMVTTVVLIGRVGVEGRAVAAQRGTLGQVIRVVNPDSKRPLRGRVVGEGRVEVLHEP